MLNIEKSPIIFRINFSLCEISQIRSMLFESEVLEGYGFSFLVHDLEKQ